MENWEPEHWLAALFVVGFGIFLYAWIMRMIFSVGKHIRQQEAIINILMKIASGEKLTEDQKDGIRNYVNRG